MWEQVVAWKMGGATYSDIAGRLIKPENIRKYGLGETPSLETLMRQINKRLGHQSEKPRENTDHAADMTWLCKQLRTQVNIPALQLFRSEETDQVSGRIWSAIGWTPEPESTFSRNWALSIERSDTLPSVSLVVEEYPAYEQLKQHLSLYPVWQYVSGWQGQIATAVKIAVELNVELRNVKELFVDRWIIPEKLTSSTDGVLDNFTECAVAAAFQSRLDLPVPLERYVIEASPHHPPNEHVYELLWQYVTDSFIVLAKSSDRERLDELKRLHEDTVEMLRGRDELLLITRAYEQAMHYRIYIEGVLDRVLSQTHFPGDCSVCRDGL